MYNNVTFNVFIYVVTEISFLLYFFFLMIRRPPRSTLDRSSAASDVYKRQEFIPVQSILKYNNGVIKMDEIIGDTVLLGYIYGLSLIHISEPTRPY